MPIGSTAGVSIETTMASASAMSFAAVSFLEADPKLS
jgi:hypothetical protein